jgi:hypothetical protein
VRRQPSTPHHLHHNRSILLHLSSSSISPSRLPPSSRP